MAGGKQASGAKREKILKSTFKAPTVGLEDVVFDYGAGMRPGDFQGYIERIAEHLAATLKRLLKTAGVQGHQDSDRTDVRGARRP